MYEIVSNEQIAPRVHRILVRAPKIAAKRRAGQFVIVRTDDQCERVPLTIADSDPEQGTITLIVQSVGRSTMLLCGLKPGQSILDVVGPLGHPTHIECVGHVVVVGGGIGTAVAMPIAAAMKAAGNRVSAVIGGRTRELVILEDDLRRIAGDVVVCTDDGSYGRKGLVTDALAEMIADPGAVNLVVAIGPVPMMEAVCNLTRGPAVPTVVSLNPIMIDGTGMCGGCRVTVGGRTKFACVDGPEFDGHAVDFKELRNRLAAFRDMEAQARQEAEHSCRLDEQVRRMEKQS
ncbi:MAG TPA: sulfide/dihydroorotate dehydrogenase-like FAD/NAD-binding protein [Phycisphaerae bacterium]|nr:sulfide/dihydroorotate dehydrogenase-like FAD/NAD-binding protein [Phycisphaerae bacterium]HOI56237.1 sulfide/dihydroorotate dehydrogenase-like FAD/NAD-binding protein [Phycisphaerae bacterium]